jgi:hypothetical protein
MLQSTSLIPCSDIASHNAHTHTAEKVTRSRWASGISRSRGTKERYGGWLGDDRDMFCGCEAASTEWAYVARRTGYLFDGREGILDVQNVIRKRMKRGEKPREEVQR